MIKFFNLVSIHPSLFSYMFTDHPKKVCMTYLEHMYLSFFFFKCFFVGAWKAVIHGVFPGLYITSTTDTVNKVNNELIKNRCSQ